MDEKFKNPEVYTQLTALKNALKLLASRYARLFNFSPIPYLCLSTNGEILNLNRAASNLLQGKNKDFLNQMFIHYVSKIDKKKFKNYLEQVFMLNPDENCIIFLNIKNKNYKFNLKFITAHPQSKALFTLNQISELKKNKLQIDAIAYQHLSEPTVVFDMDWNIISANIAFCDLLGCTEKNLIGKNFEKNSFKYGIISHQKINLIKKNDFWIEEISLINSLQEKHFYLLKINKVYDENSSNLCHIAIVIDISKQKSSEQKIKHLAYYDELTNLANYRLFFKLLNHQIQFSKSNDQKFALLFIDIDKFKTVNDTFGHVMGDLLLKKFSSRLKKIIRSSDIVARVGGDEFYIMINNIKNYKFVDKIIIKLLKAMRKPFMIEKKVISITISVGVSFFPQTARSQRRLLHKTDMAMHICKLQGGDGFNISS